MDEKKRRVQLTKEQKRALAEQSKAVAFAAEQNRVADARRKTERLRNLRNSQIAVRDRSPP